MRRTRLLLSSVLLLALTACGSPAPAPGTGAGDGSPTPDAAAASGAVTSTAPDPLIDLDCERLRAELADTRYVGTPLVEDSVAADEHTAFGLDLQDVVRNAGGVACEWSEGGMWYIPKGDTFALDPGWNGVAVYVVPHAEAAIADHFGDEELCSEGSLNTYADTCVRSFAVGGTHVEFVVGTHDRLDTYRAVWNALEALVQQAALATAPVPHAAGTFRPPRECSGLLPGDLVEELIGEPSTGTAIWWVTQESASVTSYTEHVACSYNGDTSQTFFRVQVFPGGAWMAENRFDGYDGEPVELDGMREGDRAIEQCFRWPDGNQETRCTIGVLADGTWFTVEANALDGGVATEAARRLTSALLAQRES